MQFDLVQLLKSFSLLTDGDKNGYLDEMEFAQFQGQARAEVTVEFSFEAVDLNGNKQVTAEEIGTYFSLDGLYVQSRLVATLTDEAKTLFDIIDDNTDYRLSPREFSEGGVRLLGFDANGDGALTQGEINAEMMVTFSQPEILNYRPRNANMQAMSAQQANAPRELSGPLWFRRMDRNQDGDLTWGEFLGPKENFLAIDANGDGFITLDEAEKAR
jgi:Ca2+-binding EF-hand superfamily protein